MTHEKLEGERTLMRIHIGESDKWHGKPLHEAIVEMLRKDGFSGAIILEVTESAERIEKILPRLDEMVDGGLITLEKVRVIIYRPAKK
jgi:PII-like signaling protein